MIYTRILDLWEKLIRWVDKENYHKLKVEETLILLGPNKNDPLLYILVTTIERSIYTNLTMEKYHP